MCNIFGIVCDHLMHFRPLPHGLISVDLCGEDDGDRHHGNDDAMVVVYDHVAGDADVVHSHGAYMLGTSPNLRPLLGTMI